MNARIVFEQTITTSPEHEPGRLAIVAFDPPTKGRFAGETIHALTISTYPVDEGAYEQTAVVFTSEWHNYAPGRTGYRIGSLPAAVQGELHALGVLL